MRSALLYTYGSNADIHCHANTVQLRLRSLPQITTFSGCRSTFKKGRNMYIKIGDKDVEYSKNFKLFLHTKLSKPHYPPEIQAETTLINFAVTEQVRRRDSWGLCSMCHWHLPSW